MTHPIPLSDADLIAWQKRCAKATPGPWNVRQTCDDGRCLYGGAAGNRQVVLSLNHGLMFPPTDKDTAFIAASNPLAVGNMLTEVQHLRQRVKTLEAQVTITVEQIEAALADTALPTRSGTVLRDLASPDQRRDLAQSLHAALTEPRHDEPKEPS